MKIVISCMDRRLNEYLDKLNDGKTIFMRNAGGNVIGLKNSIRQAMNDSNVTEAEVIDHTDCGAMKVVRKVFEGGEKADENINRLVSLFAGHEKDSSAELEKVNEGMQGKALKESVEPTPSSSELLDISNIKVPETKGKHVAIVASPSIVKYADMANAAGSELFDTYFIQASTVDEVIGDIEVANRFLGISEFVFLATGPAEYRQAKLNMERIKMSDLIKGNIRLERM